MRESTSRPDEWASFRKGRFAQQMSAGERPVTEEARISLADRLERFKGSEEAGERQCCNGI